MSRDECIEQLVEELLDSHHTPEEVCARCPELLSDVRQRWEQVRSVEAEVDALFPESKSSLAELGKKARPDGSLPEIPGYEVQEMVGYGGMGVVYKARHLKLDRPVAIKMLLSGMYASRVHFSGLMREARAIAGLTHPNVVQVYDVGDLDGLTYFTMEFMEGGSLAKLLRGAPQSPREAARILVTIAKAVQTAHEGGIVHRDLKPSNVLLTSDGTLKVSDFGLSQRGEADPIASGNSARTGTPSYMAPEQAAGEATSFGKGVDIYALGAILYEMLTGRPPFKSDTASETLRQVVTLDPLPPRLFNPKIPADLQTICMKCLHRQPERRYVSAAALAEDLQRFQRGEPIVARPVGAIERAAKWVRRRPAEAAVLAAGIALVFTLAAGVAWRSVQQSRLTNAVEMDLREVARDQAKADWLEAESTLERAEARLGTNGPAELHTEFKEARRQLQLVRTLDTIRLNQVTSGDLIYYKVQADQKYSEAFSSGGLGTPADDPGEVAKRVRESPVRIALTAAVDDWANCAQESSTRLWVLAVARATESGRTEWRSRIFDATTWDDPAALARLSQSVPIEGEATSLLLTLGQRLRPSGQDSTLFLRRMQRENPGDFWTNMVLGNALRYQSPVEAEGYYRAALASRPAAAVCYCAVGDALRVQENYRDATDYYEKAIGLDRSYARAQTNLGLTLQNQGLYSEAIPHYEEALKIDPNYAWAHVNLADVLFAKGRISDAEKEYQLALALDPKNVSAHRGMRQIRVQRGEKWPDVQLAWRAELDENPPDFNAWFGYAELCLFLGDVKEYQRNRQEILARFGSPEPEDTEKIGRACLLAPASAEELQKATALIDAAVASRNTTIPWIYPYYLFAKGLAEYRAGHFSNAIDIMSHDAGTVMGPSPRLVIAMAQHGQGREAEARKTLAGAVLECDWSASKATVRDAWINHILRREAQSLIVPNIARFQEGSYEPQDNDERIAFLGTCQFRGWHLAAAKLYADAFAADRTLTESSAQETCMWAARSAVIAGCGRSEDSARLGESERAKWRAQGREWLDKEVANVLAGAPGVTETVRQYMRQELVEMKSNADFAGIREPSEVKDLPLEEQAACTALWARVDAAIERLNAMK